MGEIFIGAVSAWGIFLMVALLLVTINQLTARQEQQMLYWLLGTFFGIVGYSIVIIVSEIST